MRLMVCLVLTLFSFIGLNFVVDGHFPSYITNPWAKTRGVLFTFSCFGGSDKTSQRLFTSYNILFCYHLSGLI